MRNCGRTVGENIAGARILDMEVIRSVDRPYNNEGGIAVLSGNLAPEGCVVKRSAVAPEMMRHCGAAIGHVSPEAAAGGYLARYARSVTSGSKGAILV